MRHGWPRGKQQVAASSQSVDDEGMHPRKRLDLAWSDLGTALCACVTADEARARAHVEAMAGGEVWLATLSVRSALDLALTAHAWPRGTRVLVSSLTIPDMLRVLEAHGLVPVPIDVDPQTLEPDCAQAARLLAVGVPAERPRAVLLAHLYGTRLDLAAWFDLARVHGLEVWEDAAQAWTGDGWCGDPRSDVVFLSFGPIKTGTALAGGLVRVRADGLRGAMRGLQRQWPLQTTRSYAARVLKYAGFKLIATRAGFGLFDALCRWRGTSSDAVISGSVRGFSREHLLVELRRRPCAALLATMARRWSQGERARVQQQRHLGEQLRDTLGPRAPLVGAQARVRHHWVAAVRVHQPHALVQHLRAQGFDATTRATLTCVGSAASTPQAASVAQDLVYLPLHAEMGAHEVERLARTVLTHASDAQSRP